MEQDVFAMLLIKVPLNLQSFKVENCKVKLQAWNQCLVCHLRKSAGVCVCVHALSFIWSEVLWSPVEALKHFVSLPAPQPSWLDPCPTSQMKGMWEERSVDKCAKRWMHWGQGHTWTHPSNAFNVHSSIFRQVLTTVREADRNHSCGRLCPSSALKRWKFVDEKENMERRRPLCPPSRTAQPLAKSKDALIH